MMMTVTGKQLSFEVVDCAGRAGGSRQRCATAPNEHPRLTAATAAAAAGLCDAAYPRLGGIVLRSRRLSASSRQLSSL